MYTYNMAGTQPNRTIPSKLPKKTPPRPEPRNPAETLIKQAYYLNPPGLDNSFKNRLK